MPLKSFSYDFLSIYLWQTGGTIAASKADGNPAFVELNSCAVSRKKSGQMKYFPNTFLPQIKGKQRR